MSSGALDQLAEQNSMGSNSLVCWSVSLSVECCKEIDLQSCRVHCQLELMDLLLAVDLCDSAFGSEGGC